MVKIFETLLQSQDYRYFWQILQDLKKIRQLNAYIEKIIYFWVKDTIFWGEDLSLKIIVQIFETLLCKSKIIEISEKICKILTKLGD